MGFFLCKRLRTSQFVLNSHWKHSIFSRLQFIGACKFKKLISTKMKLKITSLIIAGFLLIIYSKGFSQDNQSAEKWNIDPRITALYPSGQFVQLPQQLIHEDPVPKQARVYNTTIGTFIINPNFRIHPNPGTTQSEVTICRHPLNQNIMFGACNNEWPTVGFAAISE